MKRTVTMFVLLASFTTNVFAQGLSQYGDWGAAPEVPIYDYPNNEPEWQYEIIPFPYMPMPQMPPQYAPELSRPMIEPGNRPEIRPVEPGTVTMDRPEQSGTVIIVTQTRKLYYMLSDYVALEYPISVGKEGFAWSGIVPVSRIEYWPTWTPPKEMLARRPDLPVSMAGGIKNPLGAVAMYLGNTLYRIHGTNDPKSIGRAESSGCIRMLNEHALHLAGIVKVGTLVKVY